MSIRWLSGVCAAALIAGCDGNVLVDATGGGGSGATDGGGGTGGDPGAVTPACLAYCEAVVQQQGCFGLDDCHARCMSLYVPGCTAEVEAVLACLPDWLTGACQITYPSNNEDGCLLLIDDLDSCGSGTLDACPTQGPALVGETACEGHWDCPAAQLAISCDQNGQCACLKNGVTVGECSMPFTGIEACTQPFTCCHAFFDL